ncbi:MAG: hypothetical protein HYR63_23630 [Proteobacteria bacterium]|nr:hypothetical protein [Pseudomonadota bacterium]
MTETKTDRAYAAFAALEDALHSARVAFKLDLSKLCHPHCPLPFDHYKTRIAYAYIGIMIVLFSLVTVLDLPRWPYWATLIGFTLVFWAAIRPLAERWIRKGIIAYVMDDPGRLERIWKYGGVALVASDGTTALAPTDDWQRFVLPKADRSR